MKKFIYKTLLLFSLFFVICKVVTFFVPYHWGNPWYSSKISFLEKESSTRYNTFFFGSSRIYRQVNTSLFDKECNSTEAALGIQSFNLGAAATFCPQTYYLYEKFLDSELSENAKYCFIELMEVDLINDFFLHQERTTYWQNAPDVLFATNSILNNPDLSKRTKAKHTWNYVMSYLEGTFHLGHFGQQFIKENYYKEEFVGTQKDGFFSLEQDLTTTTDPIIKEHLEGRKKALDKDTTVIGLRKEQTIEYKKNSSNHYDVVNYNRIHDLIEQAERRGIQLMFVVSPRNTTQKLINLYESLPEKNKIDMSDPIKYPSMYLYENSFDVGHLNSKGANKYSTLLAREFMNKIKN